MSNKSKAKQHIFFTLRRKTKQSKSFAVCHDDTLRVYLVVVYCACSTNVPIQNVEHARFVVLRRIHVHALGFICYSDVAYADSTRTSIDTEKNAAGEAHNMNRMTQGFMHLCRNGRGENIYSIFRMRENIPRI